MNSGTDYSGTSQRPLIAIFGPTASGKSALAIRVCQAFNGEIVTADSRQVYRYMDIGTDKPSAEDRLLVPHHMIDLVDPDEPYTLALYQEQATATINDVLQRGHVPVLAGGTPLYINSILEGWTIPRVEPNIKLRTRLEQEALRNGTSALHDRLRSLDPEAAERILPSNTRRIIRALEVIEITGSPITSLQGKQPAPFRILRIGLSCERQELYRRTDARVDKQIDRGLVDEVRGLVERGYSLDLPAMTGIGYRQVGDYLRGVMTLPEAIQRIKWDTHSFVRHQANWFRRATGTHWVDVTDSTPAGSAVALVSDFLHGGTAHSAQ